MNIYYSKVPQLKEIHVLGAKGSLVFDRYGCHVKKTLQTSNNREYRGKKFVFP